MDTESYTVVVCDDHQLFAEAFGTVLASAGHTVKIAVTPDQAVDFVRRASAHVLVIDYRFAKAGTGLDACRTVIESCPQTRILILTAGIPEDAVREAIAMGVCGFARKDQPVVHVLDAVQRVANGYAVIDPSLLQRAVVMEGSRPEHSLGKFLTQREIEVLQHLVAGKGTREIAASCYITYSTARTHIQSVLTKLGAHSRLEAAAFAVANGLVSATAAADRQSA